MAYEALHDHLYLHVYLLVTVGSPLACRRESRRWFPVPATENDVSRGGSQACSAPRRGTRQRREVRSGRGEGRRDRRRAGAPADLENGGQAGPGGRGGWRGPLSGAAQAHRGAGGLAAAVDAEPDLVHGLCGCRAGLVHLQLRPAAAGAAHQGLVPRRHRRAGRQRGHQQPARWQRSRRRCPVQDAHHCGVRHRHRRRRPHRVLPARGRRPAGAAHLCAARHTGGGAGQPRARPYRSARGSPRSSCTPSSA